MTANKTNGGMLQSDGRVLYATMLKYVQNTFRQLPSLIIQMQTKCYSGRLLSKLRLSYCVGVTYE